MTDTDFNAIMRRYRDLADQALREAMPEPRGEMVPPDGHIPDVLLAPMRYSMLSGGKRLRPILLLAACDLLGGDLCGALPFAAACEMIHTSSLIVDDLPCMDDDDLRRGQPTCHKAYGEDMAILAADALFFDSIERMVLSGHAHAMDAMREIVPRAGARGLCAGQVLDVYCEGDTPTPQLVQFIHRHKTADMMIAPVAAGLALAGADEAAREAGRTYGLHLGIEFQIVDDLLDLTGDEAHMGKRVGKDAERGKLTWPALYGAERAREDARRHAELAAQALEPFGEAGSFLKGLAQTTLMRVQ